MSTPVLATKLYIPPPRPKVVLRPRLIERLNAGLSSGCKLTLISAPAGFGKTALVSEWVAGCERPVAWLSLDEGDSDSTRFLTYLIVALQTIMANIGAGVLGVLQAPQPPSIEANLTALLNEITTIPRAGNFILVLDDYHAIDAKSIDNALIFLIEHLPPQMHLVIATREDPHLPLARLRARDQLIELRAADLRFTSIEAAGFLNQVMGLSLSAENIAALETRTEGWIAGLQLAALSMQGHQDTTGFIKSFTGSHRFVLDYLLAEVLQRQSESVQFFLLRTSILDRICGSLCDAVLRDSAVAGQATLEYLERANLFIVPLDNERHWYRYHHLFGDLLRKRLGSSLAPEGNAELHIRASEWYENNGLAFEAFRHATAAKDVERATRLIEGERMPLHFPGAVNTILDWLNALPRQVLDARPALWWRSAALSLIVGITTGVQEKLQSAENGLQGAEPTDKTRNLIGRIATARATLALTRYETETILVQSKRALEYLDADNLSDRTSAYWTQSIAYFFQGERAAARDAVNNALTLAQASASNFALLLATSTLATLQEIENELARAAETYRRALQLAGNPPLAFASGAHLGLAHIFYEWNDLDAAQHHGENSLNLARQYDRVIDRFIISQVFLARLKLAQGDVDGAAAMLAQSEQSARQENFLLRLPEIATAQVPVLLRQGQVATAAQLALQYELPLSQVRVLIAQNDPSAALAVLEPFRQKMEAKGWADERLRAMVLQAIALYAHGEKDKAMQVLGDALALAEPGGLIRLFVDEGEPMRLMILDFRICIEKQSRGGDNKQVDYIEKLLSAFPQPESKIENRKSKILVEPLSARELEVLKLIAQGLSNREISERLFLALSTIKGHSRIIFDKLQVRNRTEAVARGRALGLL
ncbi:MAG: LuxR family transcriptional regulator [Chloroflexi bacterium]|nr:LuxR family transcriptional regulator [Chloroflexota bacterium]